MRVGLPQMPHGTLDSPGRGSVVLPFMVLSLAQWSAWGGVVATHEARRGTALARQRGLDGDRDLPAERIVRLVRAMRDLAAALGGCDPAREPVERAVKHVLVRVVGHALLLDGLVEERHQAADARLTEGVTRGRLVARWTRRRCRSRARRAGLAGGDLGDRAAELVGQVELALRARRRRRG